MSQWSPQRGCKKWWINTICDSKALRCPDLSLSSSFFLAPLDFFPSCFHCLSHTHTCIHLYHLCLFFSVSVSHSCTCPQGSARSGWKLFRRPCAPPPAAPRSAPTASPARPPQTSEACWSSAVTKAEYWCPWRGVKSGSAKQNRYFQHRWDFLSTGWQLPVWKRKIIITAYLKQMRQRWRCMWQRLRCSWMCNAESKYTCMKMLEGSLRYTVLYFQ